MRRRRRGGSGRAKMSEHCSLSRRVEVEELHKSDPQAAGGAADKRVLGLSSDLVTSQMSHVGRLKSYL